MAEFAKDALFPQSSLLLEIIGKQEWQLFDLSMHPEDESFSWDEINKMRPAGQLLIGHNYLFIPQQLPNQSPEEAYRAGLNRHPSLALNNVNDPRWLWIKSKTSNLPLFKFTRLAFLPKVLMAFTPETKHDPDPDDIGIDYEFAIDTFEKFFGTTTTQKKYRT
jgi:hypothetical protein